MQLIGPTAASFSLCLLAMLALRPVAIAFDLIDRPGGRKIHDGEVPLVGGIAMLLGILLGLSFVPLSEIASRGFLAASALLVTVGLLDDRFGLSPWVRLPVHVAAGMLLASSDASITALGAPVGTEVITLEGLQSSVMTVLAAVACINAFNMLDGMDGLAGAIGMVALSAIAFLAFEARAVVVASASLTIIGAVTAFLIANVPARFNRNVRCFMGDSGSTLLGLAVVWLCIAVSQLPVQAASPITVLWFVALPLFDFVWTVLRRVLRGVSPVLADDEHLHHLLLRAGFRMRGAFAVLVGLAVVLAVIGIAIDRLGMPDRFSLLLLAGTGILVVRLMHNVRWLVAWLPADLSSARLVEDDRREAGQR